MSLRSSLNSYSGPTWLLLSNPAHQWQCAVSGMQNPAARLAGLQGTMQGASTGLQQVSGARLYCIPAHKSQSGVSGAQQPLSCAQCFSPSHQRAQFLANKIAAEVAQKRLAHSIPLEQLMQPPPYPSSFAPNAITQALEGLIRETGATREQKRLLRSNDLQWALQPLARLGLAGSDLASRGWASQITWGRSAIAMMATLATVELLLLPSLAPGGMCGGSAVAEVMWAAAGHKTDLAALLAASTDLEAVQAWSMSRKLGQVLVLGSAAYAASRGRLGRLLGAKISAPMNREYGWYYWSCWALLGMAVVSFSVQGLSAVSAQLADLLPVANHAAGGGGALGLTAGDERTLPFRCRWWAETCLFVPMLEETIFRGFLLTSLTRYVPVLTALTLSSVAFAAVHLGHAGLADMPQYTAYGMVLGAVFLRSRNILAPIAAHSMSNIAALLQQSYL